MNNKKSLTEYTSAVLKDALACFGIPLSTATSIYNDIILKRRDEAFEILLSEIRDGTFHKLDQNEVVSVCARYQRDAMEGIARQNLRLMAKVIKGMAINRELCASSFSRYANILATLTEDEITVLAIMTKHKDNTRGIPKAHPDGLGIDYTDYEMEELKKAVPYYATVQQALVRTGLVFFSIDSQSGEDFHLDGGNLSDQESGTFSMELHSKVIYRITPLMREILKYTDF